MTKTGHSPVKKGGEKEGGGEGDGVGEAGSRHCARAPSAPVPGLQGAQRARPGPRPPDALPDTTLPGAWTTAHLGHCTGHCPPQGWTLQRTLLPSSGHCSLLPHPRFPPPPPGAQTLSPPQALASDLLHPRARHLLLPVPLSLSLLPPHLSPRSGRSPASFSDPLQLGPGCPHPNPPAARPDASPRGIVVAPLLPSRLYSSAPGLRGRRA